MIAVYVAPGPDAARLLAAAGAPSGAALGFAVEVAENPGGPLAPEPAAYPLRLTLTPEWELDDETAEDSLSELLARKLAGALGVKCVFVLPGPYQEVENASVVSVAPDGVRTVEARAWKSGMRWP